MSVLVEAIELANNTSYGLASAVFTQNIKRAPQGRAFSRGWNCVGAWRSGISSLILRTECGDVLLLLDQLLQHDGTFDDVWWVQDVWLGKGPRRRCVSGVSLMFFSTGCFCGRF